MDRRTGSGARGNRRAHEAAIRPGRPRAVHGGLRPALPGGAPDGHAQRRALRWCANVGADRGIGIWSPAARPEHRLMYFLNLTFAQFLAVFGSVAAVTVALYLLDRSRRRQLVPTLRFWMAAREPAVVKRRKRIQQPWSLILQLVSIALLLLAIAQLRWGSPAGAPRDHVLILDTSAWMAAISEGKSLMEAARERAKAYIRAIPARDRVMLVRADALTTPATAFEPDRKKLQEA